MDIFYFPKYRIYYNITSRWKDIQRIYILTYINEIIIIIIIQFIYTLE